MISKNLLRQALVNLVGTEATVFVMGKDEGEPEGDVYIGSDDFARLLLAEYNELALVDEMGRPAPAYDDHAWMDR
jgi:hypothetical protein